MSTGKRFFSGLLGVLFIALIIVGIGTLSHMVWELFLFGWDFVD